MRPHKKVTLSIPTQKHAETFISVRHCTLFSRDADNASRFPRQDILRSAMPRVLMRRRAFFETTKSLRCKTGWLGSSFSRQAGGIKI